MGTRTRLLRHALVATFIATSAASCADGGPAPATRVVTPEQDGETLALRPGDRLVVRLPVQRGTGYAWALAEPPALFRLDDAVQEPPAQPVPGAQATQVFAFTATEPGRAVLRFAYRRPWTQDPPARRVGITVAVAR